MIRGQRGFALVVTLLVTALLVALVVEFITDVYVDTSSRRNYVDGQQASILAESGVTGAISLLQQILREPDKKFTSLNESWAKPIDIPDESGNLLLTIEEENSKLNLNRAAGPGYNQYYVECLARLFKSQGLPSADMLDSLSDWLDEDDLPRPGGAEKSYYSALTQPYVTSNSQLVTMAELALVKGFTVDTLESIGRFVTVYYDTSDWGTVNINTAPKKVLLALSDRMTESLADRIIEYRNLTPFTDKSELSKVAGMGNDYQGIQLIFLSTKGNIYRIRSKATVNGNSKIIETVVNLTMPTSPRTLYWREI